MCVCSVSASLLDYALLPNTHKLINSQGIWTSRQMFCNGNHFYLDFFPLGVGRNVRCSDLSSEMGTCMKVLLKKSDWHSALWGWETHILAFTFLQLFQTLWIHSLGNWKSGLCVPPAWTRAPSHYGCQAPPGSAAPGPRGFVFGLRASRCRVRTWAPAVPPLVISSTFRPVPASQSQQPCRMAWQVAVSLLPPAREPHDLIQETWLVLGSAALSPAHKSSDSLQCLSPFLWSQICKKSVPKSS